MDIVKPNACADPALAQPDAASLHAPYLPPKPPPTPYFLTIPTVLLTKIVRQFKLTYSICTHVLVCSKEN